MPRKKKPRFTRIVRKVSNYTDIDAVAASVAAALGKDSVYRARETHLGEPTDWVKSGVPDLDMILDRKKRGWPFGRIIEMFGGEQSCKTGIGYALLAEVQKLGGVAILFPSEGNYDQWLAERYGIDLDRLVIGDDETVEGIFTASTKAVNRLPVNGMLAIMIDSIAGTSTKAELEEDELKQDRQAQLRAQFLSKAMRKLSAKIARKKVILFCVNQIREATDVLYGEKTKPVGGKALKFHASVRIKITVLGKMKRTKGGKIYIGGFRLRLESVKNRLARPYQQAELWVDFDKGLRPVKKQKRKKKAS
jgi:recombination protein RecA